MLTNQIVCSSIILPEIKSRVMCCEFVHYGGVGLGGGKGSQGGMRVWMDVEGMCVCMRKRGWHITTPLSEGVFTVRRYTEDDFVHVLFMSHYVTAMIKL